MTKKIFVHGLGHKAQSWDKMISYMKYKEDIICPNLSTILGDKDVNYQNLYESFVQYCNAMKEPIHLCGISLGGILALNYALDYPQKVKTLVLIGTPHKVFKIAFHFQNIIFQMLPKSIFKAMAFDKKGIISLLKTMINIDFSHKVKNIKCSTFVICGEKDNVNMKSLLFFSQNINCVQIKVIKKTGHEVNEENPEDLAKLLNEYYDVHV